MNFLHDASVCGCFSHLGLAAAKGATPALVRYWRVNPLLPAGVMLHRSPGAAAFLGLSLVPHPWRSR